MSVRLALAIATALSCAVPLVARTGDEARELVSRPAAGAKLERELELKQVLALQAMRFELSGVEQISQRELEVESTLKLRFTDAIREVGGGRVTSFDRTYDEIHLTIDLDDAERGGGATAGPGLEASSMMQTATVRFAWVEEEKAYGRCYTTREASEEYLARLEPEADLGALLPAAPVRPGDTWSIPAARLVEVFSPGGRTPWRFMRGDDNLFSRTAQTGIGGPLREFFGDRATGTATAKLAGVRKDGDVEIADVDLDLDVTLERDQRELHRQLRIAVERIRERDFRAATGMWKFKGKGKLEWDLTHARARLLEITGTEEVGSKIELVEQTGTEGKQELRFAGGLKLTFAVRDVATKSEAPPEPRDVKVPR